MEKNMIAEILSKELNINLTCENEFIDEEGLL